MPVDVYLFLNFWSAAFQKETSDEEEFQTANCGYLANRNTQK
jgi:hypothetical protein